MAADLPGDSECPAHSAAALRFPSRHEIRRGLGNAEEGYEGQADPEEYRHAPVALRGGIAHDRGAYEVIRAS
ncbi:hypothetical protein ATKI12_4065 [Kitasatospora sp. Ki12]